MANVEVLTDLIFNFNKRVIFIIIMNYYNNINQIVIDLAGTYIPVSYTHLTLPTICSV